MYIKDLADKTGIEQEALEQFLKSKGYKVSSIFGVSSIEDDIANKIEEEIKNEIEIEKRKKEGKSILTTMLKINNENWLDIYHIVIKQLYSKGVLFVVQDTIISNVEDYYDLTSYKLDLVLPVYDGYGRIARNVALFNSEYVLFVAYSIKTKDDVEEKKQLLLHVFNGENGGYAYIENDERKIYEKKMTEMVDKKGKSIIEVYSSLLEPNTTTNLIEQTQEELEQQAQQEQNEAMVKAVGNTVGAAILGASAANLGKSVRNLGNSFGV